MNMDPSALYCFHLWLELSRLQDDGKDETPEADALCDLMDAPWYHMTSEGKAWLREQCRLYTPGKEQP